MSADVLAQVEAQLLAIAEYDTDEHHEYTDEWTEAASFHACRKIATEAITSLRSLRATAVEGWIVSYKPSDAMYFKAGPRAPNSKAGKPRPALLLLPTPTAGTSPEHEEGA